jgi:hypothetical protein
MIDFAKTPVKTMLKRISPEPAALSATAEPKFSGRTGLFAAKL